MTEIQLEIQRKEKVLFETQPSQTNASGPSCFERARLVHGDVPGRFVK